MKTKMFVYQILIAVIANLLSIIIGKEYNNQELLTISFEPFMGEPIIHLGSGWGLCVWIVILSAVGILLTWDNNRKY